MGKKSKKAGKKSQGGERNISPGRARRERIKSIKEMHSRIEELLERKERELKDVSALASFEKQEDCPICLLPLPVNHGETFYRTCCGKTICCGCFIQESKRVSDRSVLKCEFCREEIPCSEDMASPSSIGRCKKRAVNGDLNTLCVLGEIMSENNDVPKAATYHVQAAELGHAESFCCLASMYYAGDFGRGKDNDTATAIRLAKVAAKYGRRRAHFMLWTYTMLRARDLKDDSRERYRTCEESIKHLVYGASGGNKECMAKLKKVVELGPFRQEAFERAEAAFNEAMRKEWSEARQEFTDLDIL